MRGYAGQFACQGDFGALHQRAGGVGYLPADRGALRQGWATSHQHEDAIYHGKIFHAPPMGAHLLRNG